jgi:predicted membrane-bound mannosyltransferase
MYVHACVCVCVRARARRSCRVVLKKSLTLNRSLPTCTTFVELSTLSGIDDAKFWNAQAQSMDPQTREVLVYLAKTLIAWGVPVFSIGVVAFFVISAASRGRRNDMVGFRFLHIPVRV